MSADCCRICLEADDRERQLTRVYIEEFPHRPGGHCSSTAIRDMLAFHGHDLTEDMVFGLGAGLGFVYYQNPGMQPRVYVGGRAFMLEEQLAENLGFGMDVVSGLDPRAGWLEAKRMLDDGVPVMVRTDVHYLDYLNAKVHFSGHRVVLVGYDDSKGVAFVADNDRDSVQECSLENLAKARASTWFPQPAQNSFYRFEVPARLTSIRRAVRCAIRQVVANNLGDTGDWARVGGDGVTVATGTAGLERLASEMPAWPDEMDAASLTLVCMNFYVSAEKGGTGYGGNFRRMFGRFLLQAAPTVDEPRLSTIGREFIAIGDRWTEMSVIFKELSGVGTDAVREASPIAREVSERERDALGELEAVCGTFAGGD